MNKKHPVGSSGPESLQGRQQRASTWLPPDQRRPGPDRGELLPANSGSGPHRPDPRVRLGLVQGAGHLQPVSSPGSACTAIMGTGTQPGHWGRHLTDTLAARDGGKEVRIPVSGTGGQGVTLGGGNCRGHQSLGAACCS